MIRRNPVPIQFRIWLEESFFDLDEEKQVEFIEKYYGYVAGRITR